MIMEKSLVIRKETPFDKIREILLMTFFKEEYILEKRIDEFVKRKSINVSKIIIPKEIKVK